MLPGQGFIDFLVVAVIKRNCAIDRFSNDCRKTTAKVITDQSQQEQTVRCTNQNSSNYLKLSECAGKIAHLRCHWFWFCFSLVGKLARDF